MSGGASHEPLGAVVDQLPVEDAGSVTSRYYDFQYGCAAATCLEMMHPTSDLVWVLCEWHTDYVLGMADGSCCLVSIKHREPNSGQWTIARLFADGGMDVLFQRWLDAGRPRECRWITNGGLDQKCRQLRDSCSGGDRTTISELAREMAGRFGSEDLVTVGDFLAVLRLDNDQPRATDQRFVHVEQVARPALVALGLSPAEARKAYDTVLSMVRAASQAIAGAPGVWMRSNSGSLDSAALVAETVRSRLVRSQDVESALRSEGVASAADLPRPSSTGTTLTKKLDRGEIVPTARAAAARARMEWTSFEMARTPPVPVGPSFSRLRSLLTTTALDAQLSSAPEAGDATYGNAMLTDVRRRVGRLAKDGDLPAGVDADLLMGLIYDLTARCEIWWSPEFDVTADLHE